jgi:hypothetical protein
MRHARSWSQDSPIKSSTRVPLTQTVPKPILHEIGTLSHLSGRRKLIETKGQDGVYRFETGSLRGLLDIGVLTDTLPPGLFHPSEAQCHVNSWLYSLPC